MDISRADSPLKGMDLASFLEQVNDLDRAVTCLQGEVSALRTAAADARLQHDAAVSARDEALAGHRTLLAERDLALRGRDAATLARDEALRGRDAATLACDEALRARDVAAVQLAQGQAGHAALVERLAIVERSRLHRIASRLRAITLAARS